MISVIIPTHNRSHMLVKAINSVLLQSYNDFEIIVVDDASSDNTQSILDDYINDSRISYIRINEPHGGNFARNLGVEKSKGEYIAFLDDDDEWMENKLSEQLKIFLSDSKIGLVYTGAKVIFSDYSSGYDITPKRQGNLSKDILTFNFIGTTSSVVLKKDIFNQVGGFDLSMPQLQDYDLWIRICQICKIGFCQESLIKYYVHSNGSQLTTSVEKNKKAIELIDSKYKYLIDQLTKKEQKNRHAQRYNAMGKRKLKSGEIKEARNYFIKSFMISKNMISLKFYLASFFDYEYLIKLRSKLY